MKLAQQITQSLDSALEPVVLALFMVWTLGITVTVLNPVPAPSGQVEVYALTPLVDANTGA
jgi:hypothetical protein